MSTESFLILRCAKTFALYNGCEYAMVEKIFAGELGCKWPGKIFLQVNS